jgi:hypothetical protein
MDERWGLVDRIAYRKPVGWVLHGVCGESSSTRAAFYLWLVRMPLYIPAEVLHLSWSDRVGGGATVYDVDDDATRHVLVRAMEMADEESRTWKQRLSSAQARNLGLVEALGYGRLIEGDPEGAAEMLRKVAEDGSDDPRPFVRDMRSRAEEILALLDRSERDRAREELRGWRDGSLAALDIPSSDVADVS